MSFRLAPIDGGCRHCARAIVAEGQIVNSTPRAFREFLRENVSGRHLRTVIFLNSQGGYVVASMELGRIFRRIGAVTVVARPVDFGGKGRFLPAGCLSACVYAFMGGRERVAPPGSLLGIHRMFADEQKSDRYGDTETVRVYDNGSLAHILMRYCRQMGVSAEVIRRAQRVSSTSLHYITRREMRRWRLARRSF